MLGKFDLVIIEHLRQIKNQETHVHYLGSRILNNLIESMAEEVKNNNNNKD